MPWIYFLVPACVYMTSSFVFNCTIMDNNKKTSQVVHNILKLLRNGATVIGTDTHTLEYRETCLEQAYLIMSEDLIPELASLGIVTTDDQRLNNLIDTSSMMQKKVITRLKP